MSSGRPRCTTPDVSIITTIFNTEAYLAEAIESVFLQSTGASWELLLVDDGSSDRSLAIARQYASQSPDRIRVLRHPYGRNCGISASRNLALRHARAEVLAFLDADDVWLPHKLESQLHLLRNTPEAAMVYAAAERWYDFHLPFDPGTGNSGANFLPPLLPPGVRPGLLHPPSLLDWFRSDESLTPCTCTVLVRTSVARRLNGFEDTFPGIYDDQVFYAKLALEEKIYVSLDCVARYRQHPTSCCAQARKSSTIQEQGRDAFELWLSHYRARLEQEPAFALTAVSP